MLPPRQRAILILRDVLGWQASEVADLLDQTVSAVKSALHRARTTLSNHYQIARVEAMSAREMDERLRRQLDRYVRAWETADVDGLVALLKADATFSMPPTPSWYRGRDSIGGLVSKTVFSGPARGRWRLQATRANGQPGFGLYRWDEGNAIYGAYGIQVVTFDAEQIADITTFRNPALAAVFNLPATTLPAS
jgi:RNA polymerase sigma-70 factor (ECF subfamily)